jgi:hypothetical protein
MTSVRVKRVRFEADCLGPARRENVERGIGRRRSAARLRLARVGPTRPNELGSNETLYVELWRTVGNLLGRLALIADELEHLTIGVFHKPTVLVVADACPHESPQRSCADSCSKGHSQTLGHGGVISHPVRPTLKR